MKRLVLALVVMAAALALAFGASAEVKKGKGSIELKDATGDVNPINTSGGTYPGLDVEKVNISSDGKQLKFDVTLKEPPHNFASSVIEVFFDTDNNPKTGAASMFYKDRTGFNYKGHIDSCIKFDNGMTACTGGSKGAKPVERFAAMGLYELTGKSDAEKKETVSAMGFPGRKAGKKVPIKGKVVTGVLEYADLKVKPGQTIRILMRESCGPIKASSLFPEVLLTLN
jgi:opacity protein-like surface antigen